MSSTFCLLVYCTGIHATQCLRASLVQIQSLVSAVGIVHKHACYSLQSFIVKFFSCLLKAPAAFAGIIYLMVRQKYFVGYLGQTSQRSVSANSLHSVCEEVYSVCDRFHPCVAPQATCLGNASSPSCSSCALLASSTTCCCVSTAATIRSTCRPSLVLRPLFSSSHNVLVS